MPTKKTPIKWEYCECGCHQLECKIGELTFSLFIGLTPYEKDKPMQVTYCNLYSPSHTFNRVGRFKDTDEVDKYLESVVKQQIKSLSRQLKELKGLKK